MKKYFYIWGYFSIVFSLLILRHKISPESKVAKVGITKDITLDEYYNLLMNDFNGKDPGFAKESKYLCIVMFILSWMILITGLFICIN